MSVELPEEVLERIISSLFPYGDLVSLKLVCWQWYRIVRGVVARYQFQLERALQSGDKLRCQSLHTSILPKVSYLSSYKSVLTPRLGHSACVHGRKLYIFGGGNERQCRFNDLWCLDLETRTWQRVIARGQYPSPKSSATMVVLADSLLLFGGCTGVSVSTPILTDELHLFDIDLSSWRSVTTLSSPGKMAGHSACLLPHSKLFIFGGHLKPNEAETPHCSNELFVLDAERWLWSVPECEGTKPDARFGHSMFIADENHVVLVGGQGGPNAVFRDAWMLDFGDASSWQWTALRGDLPVLPAPGYPICRVSRNLVFLVKSDSKPCRPPSALPARDPNQSSPPGPSGGKPSIRPNARLDRTRQLHSLQRMEDRMKTLKVQKRQSNCAMTLFTADLQTALLDGVFHWIPCDSAAALPPDTVNCTLSVGRGELILFGGWEVAISSENHANESTRNSSNSTYFISFQYDI